MAKVTIVLLTFNRADLLKRAITNALNQTYGNFELLIVDDYSTDNTKELVLSFNDKRIRYIKNEKNMGFFRNWQNAVKYVNSDFVIPLISDDDYLVYNKFIEESISHLQSDSNLDIVFGQYATVSNGHILNDSLNIKENYTGEELAENFDKYQKYLSLSSMVFRKKFLDLISNPNFTLDNSTISNDQVIIFDILLHANKVKFIKKIVYHWVKDDSFDTFSSKSSSNIYSSIKSKTTLADHIVPYLEKKGLINDFYEMLNRYFLNSFEEARMNYCISKNEINFQKILTNNPLLEEVYIYGRGEVGFQLKQFLLENNIKLKYFIDDYRFFDDTITCEQFSNTQSHNSTVIIATYKIEFIHNIYKKLVSINKSNFNIIEII